jgi:hypothetical protein
VVDSELLPLLLVVVPVLRASAQARQEAHLSSPESTPTAGEGEHEAKKKSPILLLLGGGCCCCSDGGFGSPGYQQRTRAAAEECINFFPGAPRRRWGKSGED